MTTNDGISLDACSNVFLPRWVQHHQPGVAALCYYPWLIVSVKLGSERSRTI